MFFIEALLPLATLATVAAGVSRNGDGIHPKASSTQMNVNETTCNGKTYTYQQLAGYGFIPSNARDEYGETIGGIGSSVALNKTAWKKLNNGSYTGILWALPDRGWNTEGTLNIQNRVHKVAFTFTPRPNATLANPSGPNLQLNYLSTVLFTGPDGTPTTGLDADVTGSITYPGFPQLPVATCEGDGYGGAGPGGKRSTIDSEGLVLNPDGSFWPEQNSHPGGYHTGRNNNQGLEGLTVSTDGESLFALMQSALDQEGGPSNPYRSNARLLGYDISGLAPRYVKEYVVPLPLFASSATKFKVAAQNIKSTANDATNGSIASSTGALHPGVIPAKYCSFLDFNVNSQLGRFGLHNGGTQDQFLLNGKWESLATVPVNRGKEDGEYFLFSFSGNDIRLSDCIQ